MCWKSATGCFFTFSLILVGGLLWCLAFSGSAAVAQPPQSSPNKEALINTLKSLYPLLEKKDFETASRHFVLPPEFKPEMLATMIQRQEISIAGINRLEKAAKFGKATERFGAERAAHFADRASVDVDNCYGFNHETASATAEVIALWDGSEFKLIRLDDVGKLLPIDDSPPADKSETESIANLLPTLKSAVAAKPDDVTARANYAMALYQTGDLPAAWSQLMEAQKLQPNHRGVAKGIGVLLTKFERAGIFAVGTPARKISETLGEPQQTVDLQSRQRWVYAFFCVDLKSESVHEIADLRGVGEDLYRPTEIVSANLDGRGWTCGYRKKNKGYSTAYYYLPDEGMTQWKEQVEIERILGGANAGSMQEISQLLIKQVADRHPASSHRILSTEENSAIIAFIFPARNNYETRHQLVRLLKAAKDVHRLAYTIKTDQPSKETQSKWLEIFKAVAFTEVKTGQKAPSKLP